MYFFSDHVRAGHARASQGMIAQDKHVRGREQICRYVSRDYYFNNVMQDFLAVIYY